MMVDTKQDREKLKDILENCDSSIREVEESFIVKVLQSPDLQSHELSELLVIHVKSNCHQKSNCACAAKKIGNLFADVVSTKKFTADWSALHFVATYSRSPIKRETIEALIECNRAILNDRNSKGQTPLMIAAKRHAELAVYLISTYPDEVAAQINTTYDDDNKGVLYYSFSCQKRITAVDNRKVDITDYIIEKLGTTDISALVDALREKDCPNSVIENLSNHLQLYDIDLMLSEENVQFFANIRLIIQLILKRKQMTSNQMINIMLNLDKITNGILSKKVSTHDKAFNILQHLSNDINKDTNETLFRTFYTDKRLLNHSHDQGSRIGVSDQKNILHHACSRENHVLISLIPQDDVNVLLKLEDAQKRRPLSYSKNPFELLKNLKYSVDLSCLQDLSEDDGENAVWHTLRSNYDNTFEYLMKWARQGDNVELLKCCDRYKNSALHVMLDSSLCETDHLQQMVILLMEHSQPVDARNQWGMTALHILCRNVDVDDEDEVEMALKNVDVLINAGADINANTETHVNLTPLWILQTRKEIDDCPELDQVIDHIKHKSECRYVDFEEDEKLWDSLSFTQPTTSSNSDKYILLNMIGPYPDTTFPDNYLVNRYCEDGDVSAVFYTVNRINPVYSRTLIHPDIRDMMTLPNSSVVEADYVASDLNQPEHSISKQAIHILKFIRGSLGMKHLVCGSWDTSLSTVPYRVVDKVLCGEYSVSCTLEQFRLNLAELSKMGLITFLADVQYVVNVPSLLQSTAEDRNVRAVLGIPAVTMSNFKTPFDMASAFKIALFNGDTRLRPDMIFKPLWTMLSYVLAAEVFDSNVEKVIHIRVRSILIRVTLMESGDLHFALTDTQFTNKLYFALRVSIHQLQLGKFGDQVCLKLIKESGDLVDVCPGDVDTADALDYVLKEEVEKSIRSRRATKLENITLSRQLLMIERLMADERLYSHYDASGTLQLRSAKGRHLVLLNNILYTDTRLATIEDFYVKYNEEATEFKEMMLAVHEMPRGQMTSFTQHCIKTNTLWWSITFLVALAVAVVTIALSLLYDVEAGYSGLALIVPVVVLSGLFKRMYTRNAQGEYTEVEDATIVETCQGLCA